MTLETRKKILWKLWQKALARGPLSLLGIVTIIANFWIILQDFVPGKYSISDLLTYLMSCCTLADYILANN